MIACHQCGAACKDADRFCAACGAGLDASTGAVDPLVGRTVGGSYTLQELVGVGGMGRVYRAEQGILGRTVAVKVIHPHLLGDEQTVARFYTEARAASRLNHPNSVGVIDFGRTDDGILYLVMEYLKGKDLSMVMHEEGPLPFPRICDTLDGVLSALGEAHALGVVHRDLKPENIIVMQFRSGQDLVKVVDFGLATIVGGGGTSITAPGLVCGTPDYMSPEQGRGERVDGRGDLYSLGVVLFELLTDELPFVADTPTKVVLRHINDPVPDPREVAPHRDIPPALAEAALRALSKSPAARFQSAEEMQEAIKRIGTGLRSETAGTVACQSCGARNPESMRFCGSCGSRLSPVERAPVVRTSLTPRSSFRPRVSERALVARSAEIEQIARARSEAVGRPCRIHISGEPGVGKSRLLSEVAARAARAQEVVVAAGPHPSGAAVPYGAAWTLLAGLLDVEEQGLERLIAQDGVFTEPMVRAGISEVVHPTGLAGFEGRDRAGAVATALATAVRVAAGRSPGGRVLIVVDDLPRCDGLSQKAVAAMGAMIGDVGATLLTAGTSPDTGTQEAVSIPLRGLEEEEAAAFLAVRATGPDAARASVPPATGERYLLPLYLEQLQALGLSMNPDEAPPRLADVVAQRIERLGLSARRVLQAAAVLGDRCDLEVLREVNGGPDLEGATELTKHELVRVDGAGLEIVHPFLRDLVEASIPAEARKELHHRALSVESSRDAPLEVRAEHAFRAGEAMSALMLLERMGDLAAERGDAQGAVLAYRHGVELARREVLETGDISLEGAIVTFSRKLGEALRQTGDIAGADGVLREAMDLAGPVTRERALMLIALGRVAVRRERRRDAMRLLGQALEITNRLGQPELEARVQLAMARVRREEGDHIGAANAFGRVLEVLDGQASSGALSARVALELGEVLMEVGDTERGVEQLTRAFRAGQSAEAPALAAAALGALAAADEMDGERDRAAQRYEDAAGMAAEAGDAEGYARWRAAATSLG